MQPWLLALLLGSAAVSASQTQREVSAHGDAARLVPEGKRDIFRIICPFLSTLVNEDVLENKNGFTMQELQDITKQAGLAGKSSTGHIIGNFANNPTGTQDIFNMEGAANEHKTSVGIHDCPTIYYNCIDTGMPNLLPQVDGTIKTCQNVTLDCELPNRQLFEEFFQAVDTNGDDVMTTEELDASQVNTTFLPIVDANPIGLGDIRGSHQFILDIFGEPKGQAITKKALKTIFIKRRFPSGFVFPPP